MREDSAQAGRRLSRLTAEAQRPAEVGVLGWVMTTLGVAGIVASACFFVVSLVQLVRETPLAGENLFSAGVWLLYAVFFTAIWRGFLRLPDWRVAPDVPVRVKVFGSAGSAVSASLAGAALALMVFAICSKTTFLQFMEAAGAGGVGKVQVLFSALVLFGFLLLLWQLFQGVMELRERPRTALGAVFAAAVVLGGAGVVVDITALSGWLGNHGVAAVCAAAGGLALIGLVLELSMTGGDAARHFCENEF